MKKYINTKLAVITAILSVVCFSMAPEATAADPTRPLGAGVYVSGAQNTEPESIVVNSILIRSDRKLAVINGKTLREKDTIPSVGAQVKKIDADSVTLQRNNRIWRVPLNKTAVRQ